MSTNSNTTDQFAQIGKAISTTASAFFGSQSMEDTILSYSSPYKRLLHQTITQAGSSSSIMKLRKSGNPFRASKNESFQDIFSAANGKSFFENQYSNSKTSFQVLSYLSEELLNDVPTDGNRELKGNRMLTENGEKAKKKKGKNEPSLFQGFKASLPVINETIDTQRKIDSGNPNVLKASNDKDIFEDNEEDADFTLPNNITSKQLNNSYSLKFLEEASQNVTDSLDLLEIQKNLAASEIREIDVKLEKLKMVRDMVFKRVAKVEQNELFLEKHLINIKDRIDMIKEYGLEQEDMSADDLETQQLKQASMAMTKADSFNQDASASEKDRSTDDSDEDSDDETSALISQSIYQKLKKNPPQSQANALKKHINYKRKQQQNSHHHRHRKTFPTLQQYYDPGSKIASFPKAHDDSITCLDFDMPFGTMCTAGKLDHEIKVWDLSKKIQVGNLPGHLASISCMQMDQYNTLITGGRDALLKLWDVEKAVQVYDEEGKFSDDNEDYCIHTFDAHVDEITALHFENTTLISGSQDRTIRQWDLNSGKCLQTIDINFTNRGSSDGLSTIRSANPRSSVLLTHNDPPVIGALQCYDAALATGTRDGIVRLWDLRSGQVVRTLEGHTDAITGLQFDSVNLVTGSMDRSIRIWDLRTGLLAEAFAYESPVSCLQFDLDKIAVATNENAVRVYDRKEDRQWVCGGEKPTSEENNNVEFIRYKNGYLIDGRTSGDVNTWAI